MLLSCFARCLKDIYDAFAGKWKSEQNVVPRTPNDMLTNLMMDPESDIANIRKDLEQKP